MKLSKFADLAKSFAPFLLIAINPALAPVASLVSNAISDAESMPGATGAQKLAHVVSIANDGIAVANASAGKVVIDPTKFNTALTEGVNTTVAVLNLLSKDKVAVTVPATQ